MKSGRDDLIAIVAALVRHWGHSAVSEALRASELNQAASGPHARSAKSRSMKPSPVQLAERMTGRSENRTEIIQIAREFESKRFLPRIGDAKDFLEQNGYSTDGLKDRGTAFRRVLFALKQLPAHRLRELIQDSVHSGPMRLGPLSEAIGAASESRRSEPSA